MHLLLADENMMSKVVHALILLGHDVITLSDLGLVNQRYPDDAVLAKATELNRAVVTFNRKHFIKLHKEGRKHSGIIICTYDDHAEELAKRVHQAIILETELAGQLIRVYRNR